MHCMLLLNSLTVGSHHVVRHSVPIHGALFFGLLTTTCGTRTIFVLWTFDCPGYFAFMAVYMELTCCLWAVWKLIGRKGHAGWQLPLTNYKYIANEPLFYWYQHNPLPLTLYVSRIISRIFWKTNINSHYDFTYVVHALNSFRNPSPWKSLYFTYIWNLL